MLLLLLLLLLPLQRFKLQLRKLRSRYGWQEGCSGSVSDKLELRYGKSNLLGVVAERKQLEILARSIWPERVLSFGFGAWTYDSYGSTGLTSKVL